VYSAAGAATPGDAADRGPESAVRSRDRPTITARLEDGPMQDGSIDVEVIEGRPPKTLDYRATSWSHARLTGPSRAFRVVARTGLPDLRADPREVVRRAPARASRAGSQAAQSDERVQVADRFQWAAAAWAEIAEVLGRIAFAPDAGLARGALGVRHAQEDVDDAGWTGSM
jgi:hypothetical protein